MGSGPFSFGGDSLSKYEQYSAADQGQANRGNKNAYLSPFATYNGENSQVGSVNLRNFKLGPHSNITITETNLPPSFFSDLTAFASQQNQALNNALDKLGSTQTEALGHISTLATSVQTGGGSTLLRYIFYGVAAALVAALIFGLNWKKGKK